MPWLGDVPEHWEVLRLKRVCARSALYGANVAATSYTVTGVRFLRTTDITEEGHLNRGGVFLPHESVLDYLLTDGDLLISRSGTVGRSFLYRAHAHGPCAYAGYLVRFVPGTRVLSRYVFLFTKTLAFAGFLRVMAISSTIENVNGEKYANAPLPLPPLPEQVAIVRFLDHEGRRIQRYIRAKRKLIKLLEEQKQAIIHRAVTRGLNSNVRLKSSGVEWLGDVPEHWEVLRSKYVFREVDDRSATGEETRLSMSQRFGLVPSCQIEEHRLVSESYAGAKLCKHGDLVLNRLKAHLGVFALAQEPGLVSPDYTVFRPARSMEPRYFEATYHTPACRLELRQRAKGIVQGFWRLYTDDFYDIRVPVPPVAEQVAIMAELDRELAMTNAATARTNREIDLLREYHTRLIADVVNGKLDVRELAANLPDISDEPETLDGTEALAEGDEPAEGEFDRVPEEAEA